MIARSGKIVFAPGKFDAVLCELRDRIALEEIAERRLIGRVPSQDVFANEPGYAPGLSKQVQS